MKIKMPTVLGWVKMNAESLGKSKYRVGPYAEATIVSNIHMI